jgi:hypothetical protein
MQNKNKPETQINSRAGAWRNAATRRRTGAPMLKTP